MFAGDKVIIIELFHRGYNYRTIHYLLKVTYGIMVRYLYLRRKQILSLSLARRGPLFNSPINAVINLIMTKLGVGPNQCGGSFTILMTLRTKYGLLVFKGYGEKSG